MMTVEHRGHVCLSTLRHTFPLVQIWLEYFLPAVVGSGRLSLTAGRLAAFDSDPNYQLTFINEVSHKSDGVNTNVVPAFYMQMMAVKDGSRPKLCKEF